MAQSSGTNSSGDYLTSANTTGTCPLVTATANYTNGFSSASSTSVVSVAGTQSLNSSPSVYATKICGGTVLTLGNNDALSIFGGIILNGGTLAGGTGVDYMGPTAPLMIYAGSSNPSEISSPIISHTTTGMVKFGPGTLVLAGSTSGLLGNIYVDSGALNIQNDCALGFSGSGNTTMVAAGVRWKSKETPPWVAITPSRSTGRA